jgi:hypothetical protein
MLTILKMKFVDGILQLQQQDKQPEVLAELGEVFPLALSACLVWHSKWW